MSATHCLGPFAERIRKLPRAAWKAEVEALPETCPHGCRVNCRSFCAAFARVQWRMCEMRERKEAAA